MGPRVKPEDDGGCGLACGCCGGGFAGHHNNIKAARGDYHQPPDGGFGRAENAQEMIAQMPRQGGHRVPLAQPGHGEQRRENAQKRLAVAGNRPVPVDRASLRIRHSEKDTGGFGKVDKSRREFGDWPPGHRIC
ncbi:hypothetical protein [Oricola nitratireducens]|uniref:hypothetical protein n=1 Tax=Oricola nitratireducens TaxID=2775868 RepID=UPI001FEFB676|nr:hypothetical protein [Oricola nitratireducens]